MTTKPPVDFLRRCQNQSGGFGGGPQQISHCAPTYASTLSLLILGTPEAYKVINRYISVMTMCLRRSYDFQ